MRYVCSTAAALCAFLIAPSVMMAQGAAGLSIENYQFQSEQRLTRTQWFVTYKADLVNTGAARSAVVANLSSLVPSVKTVDGQSTLHFPAVPANGRVTSTDSFTILVDRSVTFDFANLKWSFLNPVANPAASQTTAPVGTTITLSGAGSTNPNGAGTLTYAWAFASKPTGSTATISNANNISASFTIDKPGTYVVNLTVDNGAAQDTRAVTVSTVNSPPVSKAGPNQSVAVGATVQLNGTGSFDVDGDPLSYTWTFVSVPLASNAVSAGIGSFRSPQASFVADTTGTFILQLLVGDGKAETASTVTITAGAASNTPPVANAGPNQSNISVGATVQLTGAGSTDVNGDALTYKWTLITLPTGSAAQLSNANVVNPTFVADKAGTFVAQLIVNDGKIDSAPVTVTITTSNPPPPEAPTANAGPNQTVAHGTTVTLDGKGTDPQNLPLTFAWSFNAKPAGSAAALSSTTVAKPTFVADKPGSYVLQLIVNNGTLPSAPSTVTITTTNTAPVANAGSAQSVNVGATVNLDGGASTDADSDPLSYSWTFSSKPNGSNASLSAANSKTPTFVADVAGPYVVQLIVTDSFGLASDPKTVTITASAGGSSIIAPATLTVAPQQVIAYNVSIPQAAASDITIDLLNSDPTKAELSSNTVQIPAGSTTPSRQVFLTGKVNGTTSITASAPGRTSATTNVTVGITASLSPANLTIPGPSNDAILSITLTGQAQSNISFTVTSSNPNVLNVPGTVPLTVGNTSTAFKVFRVSPGTSKVTVSAPGFADMTANVTVDPPGNISLSISNTSMYLWVPQTLTVTLSTPAPSGGTTVSLVGEARYLDFLPSKTVNIPQGGTQATLQVRGVQVGNPAISATAPGFNAATPISVNIGATIAWSTSKVTLPYPWTDRNPPFLSLVLFATVPGGLQFDPNDAIVVELSSSNPSVAAPKSNSAMFLWDASTEPATKIFLDILAPGTTIIKAKGTNIPEVTMTLVVSGPLGISTAALPDGTANSLYDFTVVAGGGTEPYIWSATGLPNGLSINTSTGKISGTPTASGASSVTVTAKDSTNPQQTSSKTYTLTIKQATASSIAVSSGSNQSAKISTAFAAPLKAIVKDSNGNPVSGVLVTFTAPATGASGTFAGSVNTATTDATGVATSAVFTANDKIGAYSVQATASGANNTTLSATFSLTNTVGNPASIAVSSGSPQSAAVNGAFASLKALVKDAGGNPVPSALVTFTAPASGASGTFAGGVNTATTDASGIATAPVFTANNTTGGPYNVVASVTANNQTFTTNFALTNTAGTPASIAVVSGANQSATVKTAFANPLKAVVKDANGAVLSGITVTFTVVPNSGAGGSFAQSTAVTDANGVATSSALTANATAGTFKVTASTGASVSVDFTQLTNNPGAAATIELSSGSGQSAQITKAFTNPLKALVKDADGNVVPNVSVTFTAPGSGASGTFAGGQATAAANTDSAGIATSPVFTANSTEGTYNVSAKVTNNQALTVNFSLTNTKGSPSSISVSAGSNQSAKIKTQFAAPLKVEVKDAGGNLLSGVTVTFTINANNGASATFASGNTAVTDASGIATSSAITANDKVGAFTVTAQAAAGVTTTFNLTNLTGDAATITVVSGNNQSADAGAAFAAPLKVQVTDAGGNPVPSVVVTFTAPGSGQSATFAGGQKTATTDSTGTATSAVLTANNTAGSYTIAASAGAATPATFNLTNKSLAATALTVFDGTPQSTAKGSTFAKQFKAKVADQFGNPVAGVTITFTAPSTGASGTFANGQITTTAVSDASGIATASAFTANSTASPAGQQYSVTAVGPSLPAISFLLTNLQGNVTTIEIAGGTSPQSTSVNALFPSVLKVLAKDNTGQPVSGVTISFAAPASGPSGTFLNNVTSAVTDSTGIASSAPFSANCVAGGPYQVTAGVNGTPGVPAVTFQMTNVPGGAAAIQVASGSNQSTPANNDFSSPLKAAVTDACGNALRAVSVTFTAPASGPTAIFSNQTNTITTTTDSTGVATVSAKANGTQGGYNITAAVAGLAQAASFSMTNTACQVGCGGVITVTNATIGKNLQDSITITLDPPAPNGLPLTITPRDTSKALVGNALPSITTTLLAGTSSQGVAVQGLTDSGTVLIDVSAPNYASATATITFTPSGFVIAGPNGVGANFDAFQGSTTPLTVYAARLNSQGVFAQTQQVRIGYNNLADNTSGQFSVRVPVSRNVTSLGTLQVSFVTIAGGTNSANVNFIASQQNTGSVDIIADSASATQVCDAGYLSAGKVCPTPSFNTPTTGNKVNATVKQTSLVPFTATVGKNLQKAVRITLANGAPAPGPVTLTITSTDPNKLKFSKTSTGLGTASIDVTIPTNFNTSPDFYVQAFDSIGSVPYTVTATLSGNSFGNTNGTVSLATSGLAIESPGGLGAPQFTAQKGGPNANITVYVGVLSGGLLAESQLVAPGITIPVTVSSQNANVGTITSSPINITAGTDNAFTQFQAIDNGVTTITASSAGYGQTQVTATVTTQSLYVGFPLLIGKNLQSAASVSLPALAGAGGVQVTIKSNSPLIKLSNTPTGAGSDQIVVLVPQNSTFGDFYVQNFGDAGSGTYTASSALYASKTNTVNMVESSILIYPPSISGSINGSVNLSVFPVALTPDGYQQQPLAGGAPVNVAVQTSNSAVASVPAQITLDPASTGGALTVQFKAAGLASVSIAQPSGFTTPPQYTSTTVSVNP